MKSAVPEMFFALVLSPSTEGVILADQVKSLDWKPRQAELICRLPRETVQEVLLKLNRLLSP